MASRRGWTPLFLKELPHRTGTPLRVRVIRRTASCIWGHIKKVDSRKLYSHIDFLYMESNPSYFTRGDIVRIVAVFSQQQFSKLIIQISHLCLGEELKQWGRAKQSAEGKKVKGGGEEEVDALEPVRSKRLWPPKPPAGALVPLTGQEVCYQTSAHRPPEIWLSTAASDW